MGEKPSVEHVIIIHGEYVRITVTDDYDGLDLIAMTIEDIVEKGPDKKVAEFSIANDMEDDVIAALAEASKHRKARTQTNEGV